MSNIMPACEIDVRQRMKYLPQGHFCIQIIKIVKKIKQFHTILKVD